MPKAFQQELRQRGCKIPQNAFLLTKQEKTRPNNVIRGEFARTGQTDWAGLCSKNGRSSIVVFWAKPAGCPTEFSSMPDEQYLQDDGTGRQVYSRSVVAVNEAELRGYADPPKPGSMMHQGIEDDFSGKVATVFYCRAGKWEEVASAD
jgi:hypothetical protein